MNPTPFSVVRSTLAITTAAFLSVGCVVAVNTETHHADKVPVAASVESTRAEIRAAARLDKQSLAVEALGNIIHRKSIPEELQVELVDAIASTIEKDDDKLKLLRDLIHSPSCTDACLGAAASAAATLENPKNQASLLREINYRRR
jgi:hypothetical protein